MRARRLLLSADELADLQRRTGARLPPGFALSEPDRTQQPSSGVAPHPSVVGDLAVLSRPDVAVLLRAARPGLAVSACLAVSGHRGAGLLRTGDRVVQLSCFAAADLAAELGRIVPAGDPSRPARAAEAVPLERLLENAGTRLHGCAPGALRAVVTGAAGAPVGSVDWVWDGAGWVAPEPMPSRDGRPVVRLQPVGPADLARCVAPLLAAAA